MNAAAERFAALISRPEPDIPLDEVCLLIAAHQYADLDVSAEMVKLDALAAGCAAPTLEAIAAHLYGELGYSGNRTDYYDPRNSFLNEVIERRTGIPITLAIVVMEVGRRLGVPLFGVGMPGHFIVGTGTGFFDAFDGVALDAAACAARFDALRPGTAFRDEYLAPTGPRAIVARVLANLQGVFFSNDLASAAWVVALRRLIPDQSVGERRGLAQALAALGRFDAAADELLQLRNDLPDLAERLEQEAMRLRARTN